MNDNGMIGFADEINKSGGLGDYTDNEYLENRYAVDKASNSYFSTAKKCSIRNVISFVIKKLQENLLINIINQDGSNSKLSMTTTKDQIKKQIHASPKYFFVK